MKRELLVIAPLPPEVRARLGEAYALVERRPAPGEVVAGYSVAVTNAMAGADAGVMAALPDLKLIASVGTGLDRFDLEAAKARGITVQNTPDVVTEDTADFALGLIYAVCRRIAEADRFVRAGRWAGERMTPSARVSSRRVGIVGLGRIGGTLAGKAAGLGMQVRYTGPREKDGAPYAYEPELTSLADWADVLVLTCPSGPATRHLVDAPVLEALGPKGVLINVSRGATVDEAALLAALEGGRIAGAGLDVFEGEPNIDARFFALQNVVLSPHVAAVTAETRAAMANLLRAAIDRHFEGT